MQKDSVLKGMQDLNLNIYFKRIEKDKRLMEKGNVLLAQ